MKRITDADIIFATRAVWCLTLADFATVDRWRKQQNNKPSPRCLSPGAQSRSMNKQRFVQAAHIPWNDEFIRQPGHGMPCLAYE